MKRIVLIALSVVLLGACNDGKVEHGTVNDGIKPVDSNGAFNEGTTHGDTLNRGVENRTRTDIQQRDTFTTQGQ